MSRCWWTGQFAQGHTGLKGCLRLSPPHHNPMGRPPFPSFALCLQDPLLLPKPLAASSSSGYFAEGHGGDFGGGHACRISHGGGNGTCFSRVSEGGMCWCSCRKEASMCHEFEGSQVPLVDGPGWAIHQDCCSSLRKQSWKVSGRTGDTGPAGASHFYGPWVP